MSKNCEKKIRKIVEFFFKNVENNQKKIREKNRKKSGKIIENN